MRSTLFILLVIVFSAFHTQAQIQPKIIAENELLTEMMADDSIKCEWAADPSAYNPDEGFVHTSSLAKVCGSEVNGHDTLCSGNIRCTISEEFIRMNLDGSYTGNKTDLYFTDVQCIGKSTGGGVKCGLAGVIETCLPLSSASVTSLFIDSQPGSSGGHYLEALKPGDRKQTVQ